MTTLKKLQEARIKMGRVPVKVKPAKMAGIVSKGDTLSALQPDGHTFHSVTVKRVGDQGITVYNHVTKEEEWYHPKHLYSTTGILEK